MSKEEIPENLIIQLKYACNKSGDKYEENKPQISAKIFHLIGKHLVKTCFQQIHPDKISLIRCAGLFNSALARKPDKIKEIRQDLCDLCQYTLQQADAADLDADLIGHAEDVWKRIDQMRNKVNKNLEKMKRKNEDNFQQLPEFIEKQRIEQIQAIQTELTEEFKSIMKELGEYCESVLGDPPCDYALVGMGSLARQEITPYSDFENMILLKDGCENRDDYDNILEYFRWFAVIFQIVLINLQETIIPSLAIPGLNDSSTPKGDWFFDTFTSGISFDGFMAKACKMPLGNLHHKHLGKEESFELIKPISEMVEYTKRQTKTGNYLREILLANCFVSGSQKVHEEYVRQCKPNSNIDTASLKKQVEVDLNSFGARQKLSDIVALSRNHSLKLNIKQIMYRSSTLFISALGLSFKISAASCFNIIDELFKSECINSYTHHKLSFAVAIACETRLRVYMEKNSQQDIIGNDELIKMLLKMFGENTVLKYFQVVYILQCHLCKILNIHNKFFYDKPYLFNISICWYFGLKGRCFALIQHLDDISEKTLKYNGIEQSLSELENEIVESSKVSNDSSESFVTNLDEERLIYLIENVGGFFFTTGIYEVCIEYYNRYLTFLDTTEKKISYEAETAFRILGLSFMNSKKFNKALSYFQESLSIFKLKKSIADSCSMVGECFQEKVDTGEKNVSSEITSCDNYLLEEAQEIYSALQSQSEKKTHVSVLYNIAVCLFEKKEYLRSITYLKEALSENNILDENEDITLALCNHLALDLVHLEKYEEALEYLEKSKNFTEIWRINCMLQNSDKLVIGALYSSFLLNHSKESGLSESELLNVQIDYAYCKIETKNEGINDLKKAEEKLQSLSADIESDQLAQRLFMMFGIWHFNTQDFSSSLSYFDKSLKIGYHIDNISKTKSRTTCGYDFSASFLNLIACEQYRGKCHYNQENCDLAISCINQALKLFQQLHFYDNDVQHSTYDRIQTEIDQSTQYMKKIIQSKSDIAVTCSVKGFLKSYIMFLNLPQLKEYDFQVILKGLKFFLLLSSFETMNTVDKYDMVDVLSAIGLCYFNLYQLDRDLIYQLDRALIYHEKALKALRGMEESHKTFEKSAYVFSFISDCFDHMNKFHEALDTINLGLSYYGKMKGENESLFYECTSRQSLYIKKLDERIRRNMPF